MILGMAAIIGLPDSTRTLAGKGPNVCLGRVCQLCYCYLIEFAGNRLDLQIVDRLHFSDESPQIRLNRSGASLGRLGT